MSNTADALHFRDLGYSRDNWEEFEQHLRNQILSQEVAEVEESLYGKKFVIQGPLPGSSGETVQLVTVWVILEGEVIPRFVTAYPGRR